MGVNRQLASWLVVRRAEIERALAAREGASMPAPESPEAELLRRFRSFAASSLLRGGDASPALDGLRVRERTVSRLLDTWIDCAALAAESDAELVREALSPILGRFRGALRATVSARRGSGAPRASNRRAVSAAIDRVSDAFLAIDTDTARIADANPAAGALLGTARDVLLGENAMRFVPETAHDLWWTALDAVAEGGEPQRFLSDLLDGGGAAVCVEASVTRFATRSRTLALVLARPAG